LIKQDRLTPKKNLWRRAPQGRLTVEGFRQGGVQPAQLVSQPISGLYLAKPMPLFHESLNNDFYHDTTDRLKKSRSPKN
jgi:hypothetical protein